MPAKLGINGFGRIGRLVFRAAMANPEVEVRGRIFRGSGISRPCRNGTGWFVVGHCIPTSSNVLNPDCQRDGLPASLAWICAAEVMAINDPFMDLDYMVGSLRWTR